MPDMELLKKSVGEAEALLKKSIEGEYAIHESAVARRMEMCKPKEKEIDELIKAVGLSQDVVSREEKAVAKASVAVLKTAEKEWAGASDEILAQDNQQIKQIEVLRMNSIVLGKNPGSHWWGGGAPYYCCGSVHRHREGGVTQGSYSCPKYALTGNRMHPWAEARGDGKYGWTDDNDVTVYNTLWFAFWPTQYMMVRPLALSTVHGWYSIYSNDKWWNHKWAKIDLDVGINVYQNYWAGYRWYGVKSRSRDNINENGRIDRVLSLLANPLPVGINKWVLIAVTSKLRIETEGGGTHGRLDFQNSDYISTSMLAI